MSQQHESSSRSFGEWVSFLWYEGRVRHVIVEKGEHRPVDIPLILVLVAAALAPWLLAIGVVVAVVLGYGLRVERRAGDKDEVVILEENDEPPAGGQPEAESPGGAAKES